MRVAVIGLGNMGMGAALNLLRDPAMATSGCDPRPAVRAEFAAAGGVAVASAAEVPAGAEAVVVLVVNAAQAEAVLFGPDGVVDRLAPGAVLIVSATMAPASARGLAAQAAARGLLYLDAPVSGGAVGARGGTMTVMASGSPDAFAKAAPVLERIAGRVFDLGAEAGLGSTMKVVHQLLAGVHIAVAAEAMALAIKAGLDPRIVHEIVVGAAGASWMFADRIPRVLAGDTASKSAVDIFVKDLALVGDLARDAAFPAPLAAQALQLFVAARAQGVGALDDSRVIEVWRALTGIALPEPRGGASKKPPTGAD